MNLFFEFNFQSYKIEQISSYIYIYIYVCVCVFRNDYKIEKYTQFSLSIFFSVDINIYIYIYILTAGWSVVR